MRKLETAISDDVLQLQCWRVRSIDSRNQLDTRSRNFDSIRRAKLAANLRVVRNLNVRVMASYLKSSSSSRWCWCSRGSRPPAGCDAHTIVTKASLQSRPFAVHS